jgi:hypothetical protein
VEGLRTGSRVMQRTIYCSLDHVSSQVFLRGLRRMYPEYMKKKTSQKLLFSKIGTHLSDFNVN